MRGRFHRVQHFRIEGSFCAESQDTRLTTTHYPDFVKNDIGWYVTNMHASRWLLVHHQSRPTRAPKRVTSTPPSLRLYRWTALPHDADGEELYAWRLRGTLTNVTNPALNRLLNNLNAHLMELAL